MMKPELIDRIAENQEHLSGCDVELAVKTTLAHIIWTLLQAPGIEIRVFGSFTLCRRGPHMGRNPATGDLIAVPGKYMSHFKSGKELRERVNGRMFAENSVIEQPMP